MNIIQWLKTKMTVYQFTNGVDHWGMVIHKNGYSYETSGIHKTPEQRDRILIKEGIKLLKERRNK